MRCRVCTCCRDDWLMKCPVVDAPVGMRCWCVLEANCCASKSLWWCCAWGGVLCLCFAWCAAGDERQKRYVCWCTVGCLGQHVCCFLVILVVPYLRACLCAGVGGWGVVCENCIVDASIFIFFVCVFLVFFSKGVRWMPWHAEPMKDV